MTARFTLPLITALAFALPALAQSANLDEPRLDAVLDLDHDGVPDRAVLLRHEANDGLGDLSIYLGGGQKLDPAARPSFVKTNLTADQASWLETGSNGSLLLTSGCGGCSEDHSTTLTIVFRDGAFWVDGYSYDWDTKGGMGSCDINFLAGKGVMSEGLDDNYRESGISGTFAPIELADWSDGLRPKECEP